MTIPLDTFNQHAAIIGRTGSGKTYTAKGVVERLLEAGRRVCVLDPTGAWWGLRSSTDGKSARFPVPVFGGDHADVPITEHAGAALGELVGTSALSSIIDLSGTTLGERHRFVERFAEAVFRVNRQPLHLIIDEADEFAPQSGPPGTERMLGAIDRIVRRGRIKGFRVMMISQRPAVLNKNVLTQAGTLIAMRLPASQDRKAVEAWIKGVADESQADKLLASLPSLQTGEGWVWAPEQGILERTKFPKITTFDSSRTPDDDKPIAAPRTLAEVDLSKITAALSDATEQAKANDPGELRKRIKELERQVAEKPKAEPVDIEAIRRQAKIDAANGLASILSGRANHIRDMGIDIAATVREKFKEHEAFLREVVTNTVKAINANTPAPPPPATIGYPKTTKAPARRVTPITGDPDKRDALNGAQRKVLDSIAWWNSVGVERPSVAQVGMRAGIKPTGGHFSNTVGPLSTGRLIERTGDGSITLTDTGEALAIHPENPGTLEELHDAIRACNFTGATLKILEAIIAGRGGNVSVADIGKATGIDPSGGHFSNSIGPLGTLGLIERRNGIVAPTEVLFPPELT